MTVPSTSWIVGGVVGLAGVAAALFFSQDGWERRGLAAGVDAISTASAVVPPKPRVVPDRPYRTAQKIVFARDGARAYVVDASDNALIVIDGADQRVHHQIALRGRPVDAALSADGRAIYVSLRQRNEVVEISLSKRRVTRTFGVGLEPYGVALAPDGRRLYVANGQSDDLSIIELRSGAISQLALGGRDPRDVAVSSDGKKVVISNSLSRSLSIVDARKSRLLEVRALGRASLLREVAISPDSKWAFVAHVISHDEATTLQMERGWIHANGFSLARLDRRGHYVTLLLDRLLDGAANPWGVAVSPDGGRLYLTLAGVHELAIVDLRKAIGLAMRTQPAAVPLLARDLEIVSRLGIARRLPLLGALGPRGVALRPGSDELWIANAFSEDVQVLDAATGRRRATIALASPQPITDWRRGEILFNDARLCFQRWFSCASCHQEDGTMDALNWDLPNDGMGNKKSVKSLHNIHDTPPAMWGGVRKDIDAAVAAGQRFLGFLPRAKNHRALLAFLNDPPRVPNPHRRRNHAAVARGKRVFARAGCNRCHYPPTFTDRRKHDLGLAARTDLRQAFDTPSLRSCYRSAPYLHDGRAKTLGDIFSAANDPAKRHGGSYALTPFERSDLIAYLKSL